MEIRQFLGQWPAVPVYCNTNRSSKGHRTFHNHWYDEPFVGSIIAWHGLRIVNYGRVMTKPEERLEKNLFETIQMSKRQNKNTSQTPSQAAATAVPPKSKTQL